MMTADLQPCKSQLGHVPGSPWLFGQEFSWTTLTMESDICGKGEFLSSMKVVLARNWCFLAFTGPSR